jgi:Rrf2 family protein
VSTTSVQFAVAAHLMAALAFHPGKDIHSALLAASVNTDRSFVRKSLSKLSEAGLVSTSRGKNGASKLARSPKKITMLNIYRASSAPPAFAVHKYHEKKICPISVGIKGCMTGILAKAQGSFEKTLAKITLADVVKQLKT